MLLSLVLVAVVAALVVAATAGVIIVQKREAIAAQDEFKRYKVTVDGRIADARAEGIEAGKAAGDAALKAAEANERAAKLEKEAQGLTLDVASANATAAQAELALAQYRAGRFLTIEQKQKIEDVLRPASKGPVIIKPNFLSPEPMRYANELSEVFNKAGFVGVGDKPLSIVSTNLPGLFVVVRDGDHPPLQFAPITKALQAANIPFSAHAETYVPDVDTVVILVGERP